MNKLKTDEKQKKGKRYGKWTKALLIMSLFACILTGCVNRGSEGQQDNDFTTEMQLYYLNKEDTSLVSRSYIAESEEIGGQIQELLVKMQEVSENVELKAPLHLGFTLISYQLEGTQLVLNMDESYEQLTPAVEILARAAIVKTLTQIKGVDCVSFMVGEEPLTDRNGSPVGVMTADMFIDNQGSEINAYEQTGIKLYFANSTGDSLVEIDRMVVYNSNMALERVVVEQLIAGPGNMDSYPTINPTTKINSVTITDGVCYVNLDSAFLTQPYNVTPEVTIYSIVNSLAELSNVNKVQIMIDGETSLQYREKINFETVFTRNLDLMER